MYLQMVCKFLSSRHILKYVLYTAARFVVDTVKGCFLFYHKKPKTKNKKTFRKSGIKNTVYISAIYAPFSIAQPKSLINQKHSEQKKSLGQFLHTLSSKKKSLVSTLKKNKNLLTEVLC